jgi:arabinogalactan endo-1,4-beta-galactosidase
MSLQNQVIFIFCLFISVFAGCDREPEAAQEDLTFSITGMDSDGRLVVDSEEWTPITYSTNAKNSVITFTSPASSLILNGTAAKEHPMSVFAAKTAAGKTFTVTAQLTAPDSRTVQASFLINVRPDSGSPPAGDALTKLSIKNFSINYIGYHSISYTVEPVSLHDTVTVKYALLNQNDAEAIELFNSGHEEHPNSVRALTNTAGKYTVAALATDSYGTTKSTTFTLTVLYIAETTKDMNDRGGETVAQLVSAYDASAADCVVAPIDNIDTFSQDYLDDYIRGVDISSIIEVEKAGGKFYDNDRYRVGDVLELLSYYGINWVRIRLWNDPFTFSGESYGGGGNDLETAIAISQRAKKRGIKVLLDFHYSDFWAHPGQQARPKAWVSYSRTDDLVPVPKQSPQDVLTQMQNAGALPDMVQIGNETVDGFCGFLDSGSKPNEKKLLSAGLAAVREISAQYGYSILTMLHATNGMTVIDWYMGVMQGLDFDIIGLSFYPRDHGNKTDFENGLQSLANKYRKPICVVEYSVPYTSKSHANSSGPPLGNANTESFLDSGVTDRTIKSQAVTIRNLNNAVMNNTVAGGTRYGIGAFWWEPAWLPLQGTAWAFTASNEWYRADLPGKPVNNSSPGSNPRVTEASKAFFSYSGTALPSLNAFLQMMGKETRPDL